MKIAIAQLNPIIGDLTGNAQRILSVARLAAEQRARLLLTPELGLCGYPPRDLLLDPSFIEVMGDTLQELAQALPPQLAVLVGCAVPNPTQVNGGKPLFNSIALLEQGEVQQLFHKRLLPTYDVFDENRYFEPGLQSNSFTLTVTEGSNSAPRTPHSAPSDSALKTQTSNLKPQTSNLIRIGVTICEDLWNDEEFWGKRSYAVDPIAELTRQRVDLIVNLSASPYSTMKYQLRQAMLRHAALRYQQSIIYANQVGANDDLIFDGYSMAFNRAGEMVGRARAFETDLVMLEFDESKRDLQMGPVAGVPESEDAEIWQALVLGVRDYMRKCRFSQAVIGISGGIDSALVAAIAAQALGPENVLGVLMPSPHTSDHSIQDALALAENLGIQTQTLGIGELMQDYDRTLSPLFAGTPSGIAEENIQSRIRGNLLMAIANKFGHLLLSTGNKSEMAVGYCTLYGDMNGGLAVIADVPKTRVYSLCRWLNKSCTGDSAGRPCTSHSHEIIPANIITKPPSAELKPGQVDQDSLPPYDVLDDILQRLIQEHQSATQIVAAGHDSAIVDRVIQLVAHAEFKRRQAPPGLKITDRAFSSGWRMPIANKWVAVSTSHSPTIPALKESAFST